MDCGEDKDDTNPEYANTVCCTQFRKQQTEYLKSLIKCPKNHYNSPGIDYRLIISHIPFTQSFCQPFNIENKIYGEWTKMLNDKINPDLMLSAHIHEFEIHNLNSQNNRYAHSFPVVIGSKVHFGDPLYFAGMGLQFEDGKVEIIFNDQNKIISTSRIE